MNNSANLSKLFNFSYQDVLNNVLIKDDGIKFGGENETISSVIGKNLLKNTLSPLGNLINMILNLFDPNHAVKSIKKL